MWEHKVVIPKSNDTEGIQKILDEASKKGWELVSTCLQSNKSDFEIEVGPFPQSTYFTDYDTVIYLFFKRPGQKPAA